MIRYLLDEMTDNYKILIFYVLSKITEPEIRKNIWNQIQEYENLVLTKIINQEWSEELEELEEAYNNDELERVYNYDYTNICDSGPETE